MARAFADAAGGLGPIHILVNNAGVAEAAAIQEIELAAWARTIGVNLTGALLCAQQVLPGMLAGGWGRIVNIASTAGLRGYANVAAYCASKHGLIGLTRAMALEVASKGVTVNAVLPSTMDTPANRAAMPDVDPSTWTPVTAVADAIAYLAAESSGHVTGTLLAI